MAGAQGVELTITDKRGTVIVDGTASGDATALVSAGEDPRVRAALAGRTGTARTTTPDGDVLSAFAPVPNLGWTVTAEIPAGDALAGVRRLRSTVLGLAVPLGLILVAGIVLLARTLRQRREAERTLRDREANTRAILDAASDAFVSMDERGRITGWNDQAREIFGWSEAEALGRQAFDTIIPAHLRSETQAELAQFLAGVIPVRHERREITALHRDGQEFPAEVAAWPVRTGNEWGFNAFVRDITDRKATAEALATARDRALDASQLKSDFLANMSHEIRTPMNGVLGMTSLLLETNLTDEQRGFARTVTASGEALLTILNDILDFSKIEAGRLDLESVDFDLRNLLEDVAVLLSLPAHDKFLELACSLPVDMPETVKGDPGRLRQIVTNLVGNAVKFTQSGQVLLELTVTEVDETTILARFEVVDTGIGIAPANQAAMFESFSQADAGTTRRYGGTGLGLAISRQLVELMGGEIGVRSDLGAGSTFWFSIPFQRGEAVPAPVPAAPLAGRHMLVVDDNDTNRAILVRFLAAWGVRSEAVGGGVPALRAMAAPRRGGPHVALLDLNMPGMDGIELARRIAADGAHAPVKTVLLTSSGMRGEADESRQAGVSGYLTKPIRRSELHDCLATALGTPPVVTAAPRPAGPVLRPPPPGSSGRILLVEDNEVNQLVATAMLEKLGFDVDLAANGLEAVRATALAPYQAILMDCQMPILDGYEATREIRILQDGNLHTPIVGVTASALKSDPQRCLDAGMDGYLSKPITLGTLTAILDRWAPRTDPISGEPVSAVPSAPAPGPEATA